jgi:hypothetical protein
MNKFLYVVSIIVLAFAAAGSGCGGDSPSDPGGGTNGGGGNGTDFDVAGVEAALETMSAAETLYLSVMAARDMQAAADSALVYLAGQSGVDTVVAGADSTVWAFFDCGLLAGIHELDRNPGGGLRADRLSRQIGEAAGGGEAIGSAVVLTPFAHEWGNTAETQVADELDECFGGAEDGTTVYSDGQVTVARVREVLTAGPGVLLWSGHGCVAPVGGVDYRWVVFMTGENYASRQMAEKLVNEYASAASGAGFLRELVVVTHKGKHFLAVTPAFVENHGNFDYLEGMNYNGSKSVVYACCCWSGAPAGMMPDAFLLAGADCYLGWTRPVKVGFANSTQISFFENATDTCTIAEALAEVGNVSDPWKGATLQLHEMEPMMIRAQMRMKKDGTDQHGYSVGVAVDDVTMVSCFAGQPQQLPEYGVIVHFPGAAKGSWNCASDEDALIAVTEFMSGRLFIVQKDFVGVSGDVDVSTYDEDVISGKFSGTLGYWTPGQNPEEDPPSATITVQDGVFKHIGIRN